MKQVALFVMSLLLAASSAIAQDVRYNFAFDTHFKRFKTYKWVEVKEAQKVDDLKDTEIKAALEATLAKNHLTKTDADSADLYIGYQVGVVAEKQLAFYNADWRYGPGWYQEGWYAGSFDYATPGQTSTISPGELAVDIYDSTNHCLVWRGVVSRTVELAATPDEQKKSLEKSVAKLLKKYPPPPKDILRSRSK